MGPVMPLLPQTLVSRSRELLSLQRLTALTFHQPRLAGEPRLCPCEACRLGGHWHDSGEASFEAFGRIHGASLGLERSFDALQNRDSHSAKTLNVGLGDPAQEGKLHGLARWHLGLSQLSHSVANPK